LVGIAAGGQLDHVRTLFERKSRFYDDCESMKALGPDRLSHSRPFPATDIERSAAGARRLAAEHPVQELRPGRVIPRGEADAVQQAI
jgi:hypothetical protein